MKSKKRKVGYINSMMRENFNGAPSRMVYSILASNGTLICECYTQSSAIRILKALEVANV